MYKWDGYFLKTELAFPPLPLAICIYIYTYICIIYIYIYNIYIYIYIYMEIGKSILQRSMMVKSV